MSRLNVSGNQEGCISSLQRNGRKALEEMFDFHDWSLPPSVSFLSGQLLEASSGDGIPASKGFPDKGLEKDTLHTAVLEMRPVLDYFLGFNGSGGSIGSAKQ